MKNNCIYSRLSKISTNFRAFNTVGSANRFCNVNHTIKLVTFSRLNGCTDTAKRKVRVAPDEP